MADNYNDIATKLSEVYDYKIDQLILDYGDYQVYSMNPPEKLDTGEMMNYVIVNTILTIPEILTNTMPQALHTAMSLDDNMDGLRAALADASVDDSEEAYEIEESQTDEDKVVMFNPNGNTTKH